MSKPTTEEATSGHRWLCGMHLPDASHVELGLCFCGRAVWSVDRITIFFFEAHQQEREYKCWDVE